MNWEIDYTTYSISSKYMMDLENGKEAWSKPKLNKGNKLYENMDKVTYNGVEFNITSNNNERENTNNVEQQDSELLQQWNDRLCVYDSSNTTGEES